MPTYLTAGRNMAAHLFIYFFSFSYILGYKCLIYLKTWGNYGITLKK